MTAQREAMTTLSVASPLQIEHPHRADLIGRRAGPSISRLTRARARESKSGHFWSSDGTELARGAPLRSIGRNLPMADKEMIAATLAAGVLAAAPPVIDPLAAAKEAASLYLEVLDQLERQADVRKA